MKKPILLIYSLLIPTRVKSSSLRKGLKLTTPPWRMRTNGLMTDDMSVRFLTWTFLTNSLVHIRQKAKIVVEITETSPNIDHGHMNRILLKPGSHMLAMIGSYCQWPFKRKFTKNFTHEYSKTTVVADVGDIWKPGLSTYNGTSVKAAFHFRVFNTYVYARKTLNPSTLYVF